MNNETYYAKINGGILELMFLNKCSNKSVLNEINNHCFLKNKYEKY